MIPYSRYSDNFIPPTTVVLLAVGPFPANSILKEISIKLSANTSKVTGMSWAPGIVLSADLNDANLATSIPIVDNSGWTPSWRVIPLLALSAIANTTIDLIRNVGWRVGVGPWWLLSQVRSPVGCNVLIGATIYDESGTRTI